ncbi:MAG TPA: lipopolysaccharide heptosyltransferase I [Burkholderiales bacterium]
MKTSSLGDVVHHCPAVSDAARAIPGAAIDWVVEEPFAAVAAMHPAVRRVIPVAVRRWRRAWWRPGVRAELGAFRRALAAERYDAVIDAQGLIKSALIARYAEGRRHGMDRRSAREPLAALFYDVRHAVPRGAHAVERNRQLTAAALGTALGPRVDYGLNGPGGEAKDAVVFLTMTSRADKLWPEERWVELGRALARPVLLPWGSEAERARAERIAAALPDASVPKRMTLDQLACLFAGAWAVVGLDTGLTHLAAAVGARTTGIYCGSDPALTGLYGATLARNVGAPGRPPEASEVLETLR